MTVREAADQICRKIEEGMRKLGVAATAHYEVGRPLIEEALLEAAWEDAESYGSKDERGRS